jgi:protein SCO1
MMRWRMKFLVAAMLALAVVPGAAWAAKSDPEIVSPAKPLPAFALTDHKGAPFANDRLSGKWSLIMLGFTQCPDICPYTLQNLSFVVEQLSLRVSPERLPQVIFVAVDPDRDTPVLGDYVTAFAPGFVGVSGEWDAIQRVVEGVEGFVRISGKKPGGETYQVNHSAFVAVIDPAGRLAARLNPPMEPAATAAFLAGLMLQHARETN